MTTLLWPAPGCRSGRGGEGLRGAGAERRRVGQRGVGEEKQCGRRVECGSAQGSVGRAWRWEQGLRPPGALLALTRHSALTVSARLCTAKPLDGALTLELSNAHNPLLIPIPLLVFTLYSLLINMR